MIHFRKNAFHALSYCLLDGDGRADCFLFGYKLPLGESDCAFFADGIIFRPGLSYSLRRSFLSECEGRLRDEEGCVGATLVSTASMESLLNYGYVPFDRQVLGRNPMSKWTCPPGISRDCESNCGKLTSSKNLHHPRPSPVSCRAFNTNLFDKTAQPDIEAVDI